MTQWSSLAGMTASSQTSPGAMRLRPGCEEAGETNWHRSSGLFADGLVDVLRQSSAADSVDDEMLGAEREVVAWTELAASHAGPIDLGSVGGLEILKDPSSVSEHEPSVATRHRQVREHDVAAAMSSDQHLTLRAAPVQR